jgi:DNA-binding CsgD family transcriptional regulator
MTTDTTQLSEREREILRLVATGASNQQIADQLTISINTVKVHLRNVFGKIGVATRTEATLYAIKQGLVTLPESAAEPAAEPLEPAIITALPETEPPAPIAPPPAVPVSAPPLPVTVARNRWLVPLLLFGLLVAIGIAIALAVRPPTAAPTTTPTPGPVLAQNSRWLSRAAAPRPRTDAAVVAYQSAVYQIGGRDSAGPSTATDRFLTADNRWEQLADAPYAGSHQLAVTARGRVFLFGGEDAAGTPLADAAVYDPQNNRWETLPPLPKPRTRAAIAAVEGIIYVFGGWDGSTYQADVQIFDPSAGSWRTGRPMPTPRRGAAAAVLDGQIYVVGGESDSGPLQANERYNPNGANGGAWSVSQALPEPNGTPGVVALTTLVKSLLVFDPVRQTALQFDPAKATWTPIAIATGVQVSARATGIENNVYVLGGPDTTPPGAVSEYQTLYTFFIPGIGAPQP